MPGSESPLTRPTRDSGIHSLFVIFLKTFFNLFVGTKLTFERSQDYFRTEDVFPATQPKTGLFFTDSGINSNTNRAVFQLKLNFIPHGKTRQKLSKQILGRI
jgi:hypothetical protein